MSKSGPSGAAARARRSVISPCFAGGGQGAGSGRGHTGQPARSPSAASLEQGKISLYEKLFPFEQRADDPDRPGGRRSIVDANLAACRFCGYDHAAFCAAHTWEINSLGRDVLPIMNEVAKLSGGHRRSISLPRMADGSLRDVQTMPGRWVEWQAPDALIIHDVTEQKRLKNELQLAASRDHLTGLWNRRHFIQPARQGPPPEAAQRPRLTACCCSMWTTSSTSTTSSAAKRRRGLILLARTLEERTRETDSVCRWGGEEFTVLLPANRPANAVHLAESCVPLSNRLRAAFCRAITISIGVAQHARKKRRKTCSGGRMLRFLPGQGGGAQQVVTG